MQTVLRNKDLAERDVEKVLDVDPVRRSRAEDAMLHPHEKKHERAGAVERVRRELDQAGPCPFLPSRNDSIPKRWRETKLLGKPVDESPLKRRVSHDSVGHLRKVRDIARSRDEHVVLPEASLERGDREAGGLLALARRESSLLLAEGRPRPPHHRVLLGRDIDQDLVPVRGGHELIDQGAPIALDARLTEQLKGAELSVLGDEDAPTAVKLPREGRYGLLRA